MCLIGQTALTIPVACNSAPGCPTGNSSGRKPPLYLSWNPGTPGVQEVPCPILRETGGTGSEISAIGFLLLCPGMVAAELKKKKGPQVRILCVHFAANIAT